MSMTRRTVLRNVGSLTAVRSLAGVAVPFLSGCHPNKPTPTKPDSGAVGNPVVKPLTPTAIHVVFEGPWIFSHDDKMQFCATSFGSLTVGSSANPRPHLCKVGFASGKDLVSPNNASQPALQLDPGKIWTGKLTGAVTSQTFDTVVGGVFRAKNGLYLGDANAKCTVTPTANDRQVILPMPDSLCLGGALQQATIYSDTPNSDTATHSISYVDAVLQYEAAGASLTILTSSDAVTVGASQHLIFRMTHPVDSMHETDHVRFAFDELLSRINGTKQQKDLHLAPQSTLCDPTPICDIDADALGLSTGPGLEASVEKHLHSATYADCAGGSIAVGP